MYRLFKPGRLYTLVDPDGVMNQPSVTALAISVSFS